MKLNYMKVKNGTFFWRQVEAKEGRLFVRVSRKTVPRVLG